MEKPGRFERFVSSNTYLFYWRAIMISLSVVVIFSVTAPFIVLTYVAFFKPEWFRIFVGLTPFKAQTIFLFGDIAIGLMLFILIHDFFRSNWR